VFFCDNKKKSLKLLHRIMSCHSRAIDSIPILRSTCTLSVHIWWGFGEDLFSRIKAFQIFREDLFSQNRPDTVLNKSNGPKINENFTSKTKLAFCQDLFSRIKAFQKFREDLISWIYAKFTKICPRKNLYT